MPFFAAKASPVAEPNAPAESAEEIETTGPAAAKAAVIRRHHAVMNTGDVKAAAEFFAVDTRNHGVPVGRAGVLHKLTDIYTTFPDWRMDVETRTAIGNDVIVRMIVTGTHKGIGKIPVIGGLLVGVPPTGKHFKVQHIHW
jgi:predicted ester cyclase